MKLSEITTFNSGGKNSIITEISDQHRKDYSEAIDAYHAGKCIYKGIQKIKDIAFISNQYEEVRSSISFGKEYTYLMSDVLESWNDYPKRNRSVICSTSERFARDWSGKSTENRGSNYHVFPKNGSKIGICPGPDIWESFEVGMHVLGDELIEIDKYYKHLKNVDDHLTLFEFFSFISNEALDRKTTTLELLNPTSDFMKEKIAGTTMYKLFDKQFGPEVNGFQLQTIGTFSDFDNREVWFSAPALMIKTGSSLLSKLV